MFATSLFQVKGAAPSSKNDRGKLAACGGPSKGFVKEVVEGPMIGTAETMDKFGLAKGSARDLVTGEVPLMESVDVAGDTPSETKDRRACQVSMEAVG